MSDTTVRGDNVFIVGAQRSGTSVVYASLVQHPELAPLRGFDEASGYDPKELWYFRNLFDGRDRFQSPLYGTDVDAEYLRRFIAMTVRFCAEHHGAENGRWVSANPADGLYIRSLLQWMPEARVIFVLRHPQEVIWSGLHAPWVKNDHRPLAIRAGEAARHWHQFGVVAREILEGKFDERVLLVRHEHIVDDPKSISESIQAHVGVASHPGVLAKMTGETFNSSFQNGASPAELTDRTRRVISREPVFCVEVMRHLANDVHALGYRDLCDPAYLFTRELRDQLFEELRADVWDSVAGEVAEKVRVEVTGEMRRQLAMDLAAALDTLEGASTPHDLLAFLRGVVADWRDKTPQ